MNNHLNEAPEAVSGQIAAVPNVRGHQGTREVLGGRPPVPSSNQFAQENVVEELIAIWDFLMPTTECPGALVIEYWVKCYSLNVISHALCETSRKIRKLSRRGEPMTGESAPRFASSIMHRYVSAKTGRPKKRDRRRFMKRKDYFANVRAAYRNSRFGEPLAPGTRLYNYHPYHCSGLAHPRVGHQLAFSA